MRLPASTTVFAMGYLVTGSIWLKLPAEENPVTIAVTTLSAPKEQATLAEAATAVLQARLSQAESVEVVERERINAAMDELRLSTLGTDDGSALKLGEVVAAQHVLLGSMALANGKATVTARVTDIRTGAVLQACTVSGKAKEILALVDKLALQLAKELSVSLPPAKIPDRIEKAPDFGMAWLMGLAAFYAGDHDRAVGCFIRAKRFDAENPTVRLFLVRSYLAVDAKEHVQVELKQMERKFPKADATNEARRLLR